MLADGPVGDRWFNRNQDASKDWGFVNQPGAETNYRTIRLLRGRFLGGCSSTNATLCVRGVKDDYNNWGLEGWSGEEFWREMNRVCFLCCFSDGGGGLTWGRRSGFIRRRGLSMMRRVMVWMGMCIRRTVRLCQSA